MQYGDDFNCLSFSYTKLLYHFLDCISNSKNKSLGFCSTIAEYLKNKTAINHMQNSFVYVLIKKLEQGGHKNMQEPTKDASYCNILFNEAKELGTVDPAQTLVNPAPCFVTDAANLNLGFASFCNPLTSLLNIACNTKSSNMENLFAASLVNLVTVKSFAAINFALINLATSSLLNLVVNADAFDLVVINNTANDLVTNNNGFLFADNYLINNSIIVESAKYHWADFLASFNVLSNSDILVNLKSLSFLDFLLNIGLYLVINLTYTKKLVNFLVNMRLDILIEEFVFYKFSAINSLQEKSLRDFKLNNTTAETFLGNQFFVSYSYLFG